MKEITLTQGFVARVPDEFYEWINASNWCYHKGYAIRSVRGANGKRHHEYMHNVIFPPPPGLEVHHVDRNGLNNLFPNMRHVTHAVNNRFCGPNVNGTSKYKGVSLLPSGKWRAKITVDGVCHHLGYFDIEEDAARAYNAAAFAAWGYECFLNFSDEYIE